MQKNSFISSSNDKTSVSFIKKIRDIFYKMKKTIDEEIIGDRDIFYKIFSDIKIQISLVFLAGIITRIYFTPFELPITLDGAQYFWYAVDTSILGEFPKEYNFPNNGWPLFLSIIFNITSPDTFLDFFIAQRLTSIIFSAATIIPIFLLCKRFFDVKIAILGACIFIFEPRLLINSISGLPESIFIFLFTFSIYLFLSQKFKMIYVSFGLVALLSLIRYEGILLIFPFFILLFFKFNEHKKNIPKYFLALSIFILILLPIMSLRVEATGSDGIFSHIIPQTTFYQSDPVTNANFDTEDNFVTKISKGITNMVKLTGWITIPYLFFFIPGGIILFFKNFNRNRRIIFIFSIIMLIPAFYAFSRDFSEMKYLFIIVPIFILISLSFIEYILRKTKKENLIICLLIIGVIFASIVFLEYKKIDYEHEIEAYQIGIKISEITNVINDYDPESKYVDEKIVETTILDEFPILFSNVPDQIIVIQGANGGEIIGCDSCYEAKSLNEFLNNARNDDLEYLLVDDNPKRPEFIKEIREKESEYPFLEKIYDSRNDGFTYHVKIFKIDYEKFDNLTK